MVFSSSPFLFAFLTVTLIAYFLLRARPWRNGVLLAASLLFYAWGEPRLVVFMLLAVAVAYLGGLLIEHFRTARKPRLQKLSFIATAALLTANLFVFKYLNFTVDNLNRLGLAITVPTILMPIGISFYTFQILSYVIDLHWGRVKVQRNPFYLALYLSFFPQLIAGPIVRYQTVAEEITCRSESFDDIVAGVKRFIVGMAKKVLLANNIAAVAELIYAGDKSVYGTAMYWLAAVAYALQIYFDFSGYSDMAIGLGRIFGFHFLENFDYPYIARSITDFWRRWHISLSTWFRDYIYIPLGGNRVKKSRWIFNLLVVWALTGFWHGAQWNFIFWGLYYGLLLLAEKLFLQKKLLDKLPAALQWLYTMLIVVVGWVLFNLTDFSQMLGALRWMFTPQPTDWLGVFSTNSDILFAVFWVPLGLICMLPLGKKLQMRSSLGAEALSLCCHGLLFILSITFIISSSYNPFIYFRF
ncbi:MAG: MBOAT family protein [Ruminococcaceae bacterium]|nr:MBOAT family protein [Oscillospiraceae bacterium]